MNEKEIEVAIEKIHELFPKFDSDDTIRRAGEISYHMWHYSENYYDGDYDASELYGQLSEMRWAFEALVSLFCEG